VVDVESALWSLAEPPPAVPVTGVAGLVELLVHRGVLDRLVADAVLADPGSAALGRLLAGLRGEAGARFEEHVLAALLRLPSWYRVRIGEPDLPAGAWIDRHGRWLRVEARGAAPLSTVVSRAVVDEPVLLVVPGAPPTGPAVDLARRRHPRLTVMDWDADGVRLQQVIEPLVRDEHPPWPARR
jgi:hypothetical protein